MLNEQARKLGLGHDRELGIYPANITLPVGVLSGVRR
jgi:hypothetical protein